MAAYMWMSGPNSANNTLMAADGSSTLKTYDALAGTDTFDFSYSVKASNFSLTKSTDGSVTISGASNGHNVNVKLVNFETIHYSGKNLSIASIKAGTTGNDTINGTDFKDVINGGSGNDTINGGAANDTINGSSGNDTINGGSGNDKITGGSGKDSMTGGSGSDIFVFNATLSATTNVDTIKDFVHAADKIHLDNDIFTKLGITDTAAGSAGATLKSGQYYESASATSAHDADDRIIYNTKSGALYYDADGKGGAAAVKFAIIGTTTHADLSYTDFKVIA